VKSVSFNTKSSAFLFFGNKMMLIFGTSISTCLQPNQGRVDVSRDGIAAGCSPRRKSRCTNVDQISPSPQQARKIHPVHFAQLCQYQLWLDTAEDGAFLA
jgi:hypothetical protein